jgi:hypothetical protein
MGGHEVRVVAVESRVDEVAMVALVAEPAVIGAPVEAPVEVMLAEVVATAVAKSVLAVPVGPAVRLGRAGQKRGRRHQRQGCDDNERKASHVGSSSSRALRV